MISVIMPYWDRRMLLRESLDRFFRLYQNVNFEIIIANDGSELSDDGLIPQARVINLPRKTTAKNPCTPLNVAAREARGEFIVITNPEIMHEKPVLLALTRWVKVNGPKHYCSAAVWSADTKRWYNHSGHNEERVNRAPTPVKAGLHFLAAMDRSLFEEVGGFDEAYREGQGYEDSDFLWRLHRAGATFSIRDDLVVLHHGTKVKWPAGGTARNREIFWWKWQEYIRCEGVKQDIALKTLSGTNTISREG